MKKLMTALMLALAVPTMAQADVPDYKLVVETNCPARINKNSDGSWSIPIPYPTFTQNKDNTISVNWYGLILFKAADKNGEVKGVECGR